MSELMRKWGMTSFGMGVSEMKLIEYWFWVLYEWTCIKEEGQMKYLGAGIASSSEEILTTRRKYHTNPSMFKEFDPHTKHFEPNLILESVQEQYFYEESFKRFIDKQEEFLSLFSKPFNLLYDSKSNIYIPDRTLIMKMDRKVE